MQFTQVEATGQKRRLSRIFPTKTEAKKFLQGLRRGERIEAARSSRELTLKEWFDWLAENDWPDSIAEVTIGYRTKRFAKYVEKELGDTPLTRIDPMRVRAFYRKLREGGMGEWQLIAVKSDLVRAFNQAIIPYQRVATSVANPFRLPVPQPVPRVAVALTPVQVREALAQPELNDSQRAMLGVLLLAGLRLGEMMALMWGQLRFEDHVIIVDRAVKIGKGGRQSVGPPKGNKTRNAVMCPTLRKLIEAHAGQFEPGRHLWRATVENIPRMKKLVYASWRALRKASKLPVDMSPPTVSSTTLKEHVGHAAAGVTEASYTRPLSTAQEILRNEIERVIGA